jgi:tetratricopeptide (TPR) repeat protein
VGLSIARVQGGNLFVGLATGMALASLIWLVREPMTKLGAAWFILFVLPSLLLPSVWGFADHSTYLPQMGLMMALVWSVRQWWRIAAKGAVVLLVAWLALSWVQLHHFQGTVPLLANAIAVNPANPEARLGLGLALAGMSNPAAAAEQLAVVTKARPDSELAWVGYGRALTSQRRAADALRVLDEAVKRLPQSAEARFERGIALQNVNRVPEAEQNFIEALNLGLDARNGAIAYNNLGSYAAQRQEIAQAQKYFEQAFKLDLGFALAHRNYAMTLVAQKQLQKAIDHLQRKAVLWTNNDRLVGEYLAALMTQNYQEQYKKEQEQVALEKAAEKKAAEKK